MREVGIVVESKEFEKCDMIRFFDMESEYEIVVIIDHTTEETEPIAKAVIKELPRIIGTELEELRKI